MNLETSIVPQAPPQKKKKTSDMRFTEQEDTIFLDLMELILPLGHEMWMDVTNKFNAQVGNPDRYREKAALQDKFNRLLKNKKPTGDPNCPWQVKRAKRIEYQRQNRSNFRAMGTDVEEAGEQGDDGSVSEVTGGSNHVGTTVAVATNASTDSNNTASANTRKRETPKPGKPVSKKGAKKTDKEDDGMDEKSMIQAYLEVSKAEMKESRRRDRSRRKEEAKKERRHQTFMLSAMQSMTACVVAAITKTPPITNTAADYMQQEDEESSDSSSSSSSSSEESSKKSKRKKKGNKRS